jgi:MFS family permease
MLPNRRLLPFYVTSLLFAFSQALMIPILPLYVKNFDVSYTVVGLVLACSPIGTVLGDVPAGMILRRRSGRSVMVAGVVLFAAPVVALFWTHSLGIVVGFQLLSGFGRALFKVTQHNYVTGTVARHARGRSIAVLGGVFRVGNLVGPAVGGLVAEVFGLRAPFLLVGGVCIGALVMITGLRESFEPGLRPAARSGLGVLKDTYYALATAGTGQIMVQLVRAGRNVIIPLYGADGLGLSVGEIGTIVSFAWGIDMSLFMVAGWIMDRFGRKWAIVPSFVIQAAGMLLIPLTGSFMGLLAVTALIGFGNGFSAGAMMTVGADLAPLEGRSAFLGVWNLMGDIGVVGGPLVVGNVADLVALPTAAVALGGVALLAAYIFGRLVPETLKSRFNPPGSTGTPAG